MTKDLKLSFIVASSLILAVAVDGRAQSQDEERPELAMAAKLSRPVAEADGEKRTKAGSVAILRKRGDAFRNDVPEAAVIEGESAGGKQSESSRRVSRSRPLPWVEVEQLEPSISGDRSKMLVRPGEGNLPPWSLFTSEGRYEEFPGTSLRQRLFYCPPPRKTGFAVAVERLAKRKYYSEVRRFMKRGWRKQFLASPTTPYGFYLDGLTTINHIGRNPQEYDQLMTEQFSNEFRESLFRQTGREGERDFELYAWGPLVVMDSGSVRLDLGRAVHLDLDEPTRNQSIQPEAKPVLSNEDYRVSTSLKLGFDPVEAWKSTDPTWVVDRYGLTVDVTWLSDVLGREVLTTEFEVEFERDGEFAGIVNFVFRSRR